MHQKLMSKFSKQIGYPLFWRTRGLEVKSKLAKLQTSQWLSREEVEAIQWQRLSRLLEHTYANVPYYRKVFDDLRMKPQDIVDYDMFRKLPLLSKADVRTNFEALVATNIDRRTMKLDWTGGSTGENITFLEDKTELGYRFANTVRGDSIAGLDPGIRFVELWGAAFDAPHLGRIGSFLSRIAFRKIFLNAFDLSEDKMRKYVQCVNDFKPEVILAYPSPLYHFATFISTRGLKVHPMTSIITSAETLSEHQREVIECIFGCKVFNRYGCREFGNLGTECEAHNGIHIFSDMYLVEILRDGNPVGQGELGEIIVTDLHKYGMPLIRYRIGDLGVPSCHLCVCGRGLSVLREIQGRVFDVVTGANGQYLSGNFFSFVSRTVPGIAQFQVTQEKLNEIVMYIVRGNSFQIESLTLLEHQIQERCGAAMKVRFNLVDHIPLPKSGKNRLIISNVPVKFN